MRTLFVSINGQPDDPKLLWETYKLMLSEDFLRQGMPRDVAVKSAYRIIAFKLNVEAANRGGFMHWVNTFGMEHIEGNDVDPMVEDECAVQGGTVDICQ